MRIIHPFQQVGKFFQDLFFPNTCCHCGKMIEQATPINPFCPHCLSFLTEVSAEDVKSNILDRLQPNFIDHLWIAFQFNSVIREILHLIKYKKMPDLGCQVGGFIRQKFTNQISDLQNQPVLPIPLHPVRRKEREYNQSSQIARGLFGDGSETILEGMLIRKKYTSTQTKLTRKRRKINVKNAFKITNPQVIHGKTIVLVDDVITTGATMNECAKLLKLHGATRVLGVAIAVPLKEEWDWENRMGEIAF